MQEVIKHVACPYCGSCCDDLEITVDDGKIIEVKNACIIGTEIYHHASREGRVGSPRRRQPDGTYKDITYDEAIDFTAKMLIKAKKPLIFGFGSTNCEGMAAAGRVAEDAGAVLDNCASICHGSSFLAIFDTGYPSCTLGEVKNRADVVVYWGSNPAHAHPRHMSRYGVFPRGFFTGKGARGRKVIVVDPRYTDTARCADHFLQVQQGHDYDLFDAFRMVMHGHGADLPAVVAGIPKEKILEVCDVIKAGRYVHIFFGMGLCHSDGRNHNVDIAINLVRDINEVTKCTIMAMRGHYNIAGPGVVWAWQFGFPYCIDLTKGSIAHMNPGETSSVDLANRGEIDAFINIGTDAGAHFPIRAFEKIGGAGIPMVTIDPSVNMAATVSDVHIPVAIVGVETGGICYRMDNVPIQYRSVIKPFNSILTDEQLFDKIYERMQELKNAGVESDGKWEYATPLADVRPVKEVYE